MLAVPSVISKNIRRKIFMNNEKKNKPLIVELEDAKAAFIQLVNTLQQKGLPCYLIEMALSPAFAQLQSGAHAELKMARQQTKEEVSNHEDCGCGCQHESKMLNQ
jgi:hypothetical protein